MARKKSEVVAGGTVKPQRKRSVKRVQKNIVKKNFFARTWERFVHWLKN